MLASDKPMEPVAGPRFSWGYLFLNQGKTGLFTDSFDYPMVIGNYISGPIYGSVRFTRRVIGLIAWIIIFGFIAIIILLNLDSIDWG